MTTEQQKSAEKEIEELKKIKITENERCQGSRLIREGVTTLTEYLLFIRVKRMFQDLSKKEK